MAYTKAPSCARDMLLNGRTSVLPPKAPFPAVDAMPKQRDVYSHHQRTFSDNFLMEEKPSWLDDLLDEPETPPRKGCHHRSSSDSFTYNELTNDWNTKLESQEDRSLFLDLNTCSRTGNKQWDAHALLPCRNVTFTMAKGLSQQWSWSAGDLIETSYRDAKPSAEKNGASNSNSSETDEKQHIQQKYAQRSRVRKLEYIAELERSVQALQAEGSEASAELEFTDQRIFILNMENKALKQHLESIAQEQMIKYMEHEMLEREVGRLRNLYQQQQQMQTLPNPTSHRRTSSKDLEQHFANLSLKYKEASE